MCCRLLPRLAPAALSGGSPCGRLRLPLGARGLLMRACGCYCGRSAAACFRQLGGGPVLPLGWGLLGCHP
eukprot:10261399-Alexandrium_andersonii.AAC.1